LLRELHLARADLSRSLSNSAVSGGCFGFTAMPHRFLASRLVSASVCFNVSKSGSDFAVLTPWLLLPANAFQNPVEHPNILPRPSFRFWQALPRLFWYPGHHLKNDELAEPLARAVEPALQVRLVELRRLGARLGGSD